MDISACAGTAILTISLTEHTMYCWKIAQNVGRFYNGICSCHILLIYLLKRTKIVKDRGLVIFKFQANRIKTINSLSSTYNVYIYISAYVTKRRQKHTILRMWRKGDKIILLFGVTINRCPKTHQSFNVVSIMIY